MRKIDELALLCEALEVPRESVTTVSREPLGQGSVTGFDVSSAEHAPLRYYVDTSGLRVKQETGMLLGSPESPEVRIWLHPADPHLPALQTVAVHQAAESLLTRIGLAATGTPEFVAYRPGRRAVLRVEAQGSDSQGTVWVKIVRPSRVERIAATQAACLRAGLPVPDMPTWSPEGLVLLQSASGTPGTHFVWDAPALIDEVDQLRHKISGVDVAHRLQGVASRLDWYAGRVRDHIEPARVERIEQRSRAILADSGERQTQVVHGDLHFGQLFFDDSGAVSGLIDVDTMGVGDAAEDPAAFIAHATVSAMMTESSLQSRVWALADEATARWGHDMHVRALFAVHMLGHALGAIDGAISAVSDSANDSTLSADLPNSSFAQQILTVAEAVLDGGLPSDSAAGL